MNDPKNTALDFHAANLALSMPQVLTLAPEALTALAHILTLFADHTIAYKVGRFIGDHLTIVSLAGSLIGANSGGAGNPKDDAGMAG